MRDKCKCAYCGAAVVLIRISANKTMLCDAGPVVYCERANGATRIVTQNGEILKAVLSGKDNAATGIGYIPHKYSCPNYKSKCSGGGLG